MAKRPYIQFYIGDYIKDTRILPLNVRGAWVDLILFMWDNQHKGEISGTIEEFSRLMCCSIEEANLVIQTLKQKNIFSYEELPGGILKIVSRKQKRMDQLSQIRSESGKNGGNPALKQPKQENLLNQKDKLNAEYEYDNEIKDRIEDNKGGMGGKKEEREGWNQMPGQNEMDLVLPDIKAGSALQFMTLTGSSPTKEDISKLWHVFKVQNFTGSKFYNSENDVFSHFINWSKQQKVNGTHQQQPGKSNPRTAGVNRLLGNLKDKLSAGGTANTGG
jgi:uncharacterized protein YdaU (DUF1376 family)